MLKGGFVEADGSFSATLCGSPGDVLYVTAERTDGEPWEVCFLLGEAGTEPVLCGPPE